MKITARGKNRSVDLRDVVGPITTPEATFEMSMRLAYGKGAARVVRKFLAEKQTSTDRYGRTVDLKLVLASLRKAAGK